MSFIERLELTMEEKQIYKLLLGYGQLTAIELCNFGDLHYSKVQKALEGLAAKGAAGVSEGYIEKYYCRIPLDYLGEASEKISNEIREQLKESSTFLREKKTNFHTIVDSLRTQLTDSVYQKSSDIDAKFTQFNTDTQNNSKQQNEELSRKSNELKDNLASLQEAQKVSVISSINGSIEDIKSNMVEFQNNLSDTISDIKQSNLAQIQSAQTKVEQSSTQSIEKIQVESSTVKSKMEQLTESYVTEVDSIASLLETDIDKTKIDVREFNQAQTEKNLEFSSAVSRKAGETIDQLSDTVSLSLEDLNGKLGTILNSKITNFSTKLQEAIDSMSEHLHQVKEEAINELVENKNSAIYSTITGIKDKMAIKFTDFQNEEQTQRNNLISERDVFNQKLEAHYNETLTSYKQTVQNIREQAINRFRTFGENLTSELNEITTGIVEGINSYRASFKTLTDQIDETITQGLERNHTTVDEKWKHQVQNLDVLFSEHETKIVEQNQESINNLNNTITKLSADLNNFLQQSVDSMVSAASSIVETTKAGLQENRTLIAGSLGNEVDEAKNYVEESEQYLNTLSNSLMSTTQSISNDFKTLDATSKQVSALQIRTSTIIGIDAVMDHIARIIKATKNRTTIMAPKKEYIPIAAIKELSSTVQVTIVTSINEGDPWVADVLESQANVKIRALREGPDTPKFIGVERENEEVLIAATDEATGEVVGFMSQSTYFADAVSFLITGNAMSMSKPLS